MTYAGARGSTATQMARTLHFGANPDQLAASFGALQTQLSDVEKKKGLELNVANGLWAQKDHPFLPAFLDAATRAYQANLQQTDFRTGAESARAAINDWVSQKTKGKIADLLQPGVVNASHAAGSGQCHLFQGSMDTPVQQEQYRSLRPFRSQRSARSRRP